MFYERFVQLCDENSEKPTNVLKEIGVSSGNLKNWKAGASVKSDILMQISEHFNVSTDYLLGKTDQPNYTYSINGDNNTQAVSNGNCSPIAVTTKKIQVDKTTEELVELILSLPLMKRAEAILYLGNMK